MLHLQVEKTPYSNGMIGTTLRKFNLLHACISATR